MGTEVDRLVTVRRQCPRCGSLGHPIEARERYAEHPSRYRRGNYYAGKRTGYTLTDAAGRRIDHQLPRSQCNDCGIERLYRKITLGCQKAPDATSSRQETTND